MCQFILRPYRSYVGSDARFLVLEVRDLTVEHRTALGPAEPGQGGRFKQPARGLSAEG